MEIKGISVKSIPDYVANKYPDRYNVWINELPAESKKIMQGYILINNWYPLTPSLTIPIHTIAKVFFNNDVKKAAWEMGRHSATEALTGVYKLFVQLGSPSFIIGRASRVFQTYFKPSDISVIKQSNNSIECIITEFSEIDEAVEYNIGGWIEKALEMSGCKNIKVTIERTYDANSTNTHTHINAQWS